MELKFSVAAVFLLFLVLARPDFSQGRAMVDLDSEIYEIDYRGPETHSYNPPPNRSRGKASIHAESVTPQPKFKVSRAQNVGRDGNSIHG
ncbi:hypothetical protein HHK36_011143 [Tetracentron sinense]|uniref:Uncharacterized protein n=1 Tax=Tetracentron sinense TaxID=13715 RepID=A0A834Z8N4_TETSI|nr:hypothetical protein HHK36_011143 [Tetracentron sinense]